MDVGKNGVIYTREESISISNKVDKGIKNYRSNGKCMYCECNNDSIDSHTISKEGSLSTISIDREVGYFDSRREGLERSIQYKKVNINNATTFKGFCSKHDNELFKYIDNNSKIKTGKEILLQAYRSICRSFFDEGYYKFLVPEETLNAEQIRKYLRLSEEKIDIDNLSDSQIMSMYKSCFDKEKEKLREPLEMLLKYKESIENDIKNNFTNINTTSDSSFSIIKTSDQKVTILYNWFDWKIPVGIFNHFRLKAEKSVDCILNFTYIPYENSSEIFWIFLSKDFSFFEKYWKCFLSKKINILNTIESCMMMLENWYINPEVISKLPEKRKKVLSEDMYFVNERSIFKEYDMSIFDDIRTELINSNMCDVKKENCKFKVPQRKNYELRMEEYKRKNFQII